MTAGQRLYLSVGLISAAALAYQLLLLRLLAVVQWSILAGTVVSLALLGHGASGSALALLRRRSTALAPQLYITSAACFAIAAPLCFALAQRVPFNTLELAWDAAQWPRLAAVYGLLALPFFFAAAC
ncbi:MAG: SAM-dependent methyltransferase, partial [Gammaproteobacteria bacterium]